MGKEAWFRNFERNYNAALDRGLKPDRASEQAAEEANKTTAESLLDQADMARVRRKEGQ